MSGRTRGTPKGSERSEPCFFSAILTASPLASSLNMSIHIRRRKKAENEDMAATVEEDRQAVSCGAMRSWRRSPKGRLDSAPSTGER